MPVRSQHNPAVSVIIPAYNAVRYLGEAIESVLDQTFQDLEILVVDDGSIDDTLRIARHYENKIKIYSLANRGPSAARNVGINQANGEFLAFLDADDRFLPAKLSRQVAYLRAHPDVDVVYSNGYCLQGAGNGKVRQRTFSDYGFLHPTLGDPQSSLRLLAIQNAFPIHAALSRRQAILDVGGFDEALFGREDWDLWLRIAEDHRFAYLDEYVAEYRLNTGGVTDQVDRQAQAVRRIGQKVEAAHWFERLPVKDRSDFYFCWGVQELEYENTTAALECMQHALKLNAGNHLARAAAVSIRLFGRRAIAVYHWKRSYLGPRSSKYVVPA